MYVCAGVCFLFMFGFCLGVGNNDFFLGSGLNEILSDWFISFWIRGWDEKGNDDGVRSIVWVFFICGRKLEVVIKMEFGDCLFIYIFFLFF